MIKTTDQIIADRAEQNLRYRDLCTRKIVTRLREMTIICRDDMHEPDEQDVSAKVRGNHLDNAFGGDASPDENCNEFTVGITDGSGKTEWFNLADLLAIVRRFPV